MSWAALGKSRKAALLTGSWGFRFLEIGSAIGLALKLSQTKLCGLRLARAGEALHDSFQTPNRLSRLPFFDPGFGERDIHETKSLAQVVASLAHPL